MNIARIAVAGITLLAASVHIAHSEDAAANLAKKLSNPVASLTSWPFQYNHDSGYGISGSGSQDLINIQPVMPFSISPGLNLIVRTIVPLVSQHDFAGDGETHTGFGNTIQSYFLSPKEPTTNGLIWGVGPVFSIPTATNGIANPQWGAGITGVALKQSNGWTYGVLANQLWSISDEDRYGSYSVAFIQPFVSFTTKTYTTFVLNTESSYNWDTAQWTVPINFNVAQMLKIGGKPVQIGAGVRYWAEGAETGADSWGARLTVTYLFPK